MINDYEPELLPPKNLDLEKICRVCLKVEKLMRPLFTEKIASILMDCVRINVAKTDGWPDKICQQCVYTICRFHSFKIRAEIRDTQLRDYIKSLTVIVEEQAPPVAASLPQTPLPLTQIVHQQQQLQTSPPTASRTSRLSASIPSSVISAPTQQQQINVMQLCQLVQTSNGTLQMIQANGQPIPLQSVGQQQPIDQHKDMHHPDGMEVIAIDDDEIDEEDDDENAMIDELDLKTAHMDDFEVYEICTIHNDYCVLQTEDDKCGQVQDSVRNSDAGDDKRRPDDDCDEDDDIIILDEEKTEQDGQIKIAGVTNRN